MAALFNWRFDAAENEYWFRLGDRADMPQMVPLDGVRVRKEDDYCVIEFHYSFGEILEEDPGEFDADDRERMRSLLRKLGYKKTECWEWGHLFPYSR